MGGVKVERQVYVTYNTASAVCMMLTGRQKFEYDIMKICSDNSLEFNVVAEPDVNSLTLMEREIANEDSRQQQEDCGPVSLLLA